MERGQLAAAARSYERAVRLAQDSSLARDFLGIAYLKQGRFAAARDQFRKEVSLAPASAYGWARIADVDHAQGDLKGAIRALVRAVSLQPELGQLYLNLGVLYLQSAELGKAVSAMERHSELEPLDHYGHYLRGNLLYRLARIDDAERALEAAIRLAPQVGLYQFALAKVILRRQATPANSERARTLLVHALELGVPEPAEAHYHLGLCFQRIEDWANARRELEIAVRLAPEAWAAWYALQEVLGRLGANAEAQRALQRFRALRAREDARMQQAFFVQEVARHPDRADARYQLAEFLSRAGDPGRAGEELSQARRLVATGPDAAALRQRIHALDKELARAKGKQGRGQR
jgi:tetratricopeptide (TPR) repeat protein